MNIRLTLDLKTIIVILAILIMIFMIFSETNMKIYKKINEEPKRLLIKNPMHPMPLPVPKPFAMPFPMNTALMGGLRIHERD